MPFSRRTLLRRIGAATVGGAVVPSLVDRAAGAARGESVTGAPIRLHRNENAYGPSAAAISAMEDVARAAAHRYAEADVRALRDRIAQLHGVGPEQVVLGC